jgi:hypothetical protein
MGSFFPRFMMSDATHSACASFGFSTSIGSTISYFVYLAGLDQCRCAANVRLFFLLRLQF